MWKLPTLTRNSIEWLKDSFKCKNIDRQISFLLILKVAVTLINSILGQFEPVL